MAEDPYDVRKHTKWGTIIPILIALVSGIYAFGGDLLKLGRSAENVQLSASKADKLEGQVNQMSVDIVRAKMQAESASATSLRVEEKVDKTDGKVDHMTDRLNDVLIQLRLNGRR